MASWLGGFRHPTGQTPCCSKAWHSTAQHSRALLVDVCMQADLVALGPHWKYPMLHDSTAQHGAAQHDRDDKIRHDKAQLSTFQEAALTVWHVERIAQRKHVHGGACRQQCGPVRYQPEHGPHAPGHLCSLAIPMEQGNRYQTTMHPISTAGSATCTYLKIWYMGCCCTAAPVCCCCCCCSWCRFMRAIAALQHSREPRTLQPTAVAMSSAASSCSSFLCVTWPALLIHLHKWPGVEQIQW